MVRNQYREKPQHCHDLSPTMGDWINVDAGLLGNATMYDRPCHNQTIMLPEDEYQRVGERK